MSPIPRGHVSCSVRDLLIGFISGEGDPTDSDEENDEGGLMAYATICDDARQSQSWSSQFESERRPDPRIITIRERPDDGVKC